MEDVVHSKFASAQESPGFLLWRASMIWRRRIEEQLAFCHLTHVQFVLLTSIWYLTRDGKALISQRELAEFTACDVNVVSQILRALEKKGLIERIRKEEDERSKFPKVTHCGELMLQFALGGVESVDEAFFGPLNQRLPEFMQALALLGKKLE